MNELEQRAVWKRQSDCSRIDVTIKSADSSTNPETSLKVDVLQEVAMMAQFRHPNIVKLHGTVNDGRVSEREKQSCCPVLWLESIFDMYASFCIV